MPSPSPRSDRSHGELCGPRVAERVAQQRFVARLPITPHPLALGTTVANRNSHPWERRTPAQRMHSLTIGITYPLLESDAYCRDNSQKMRTHHT